MTENIKNDSLMTEAISLAELVIKILDEKAREGCIDKTWLGFENGNGDDIGEDIEQIVIKAKKFISNCR